MHTYLTSLVIFGPKLEVRKNIVISTVSLLRWLPLLRVASKNQIQNFQQGDERVQRLFCLILTSVKINLSFVIYASERSLSLFFLAKLPSFPFASWVNLPFF